MNALLHTWVPVLIFGFFSCELQM